MTNERPTTIKHNKFFGRKMINVWHEGEWKHFEIDEQLPKNVLESLLEQDRKRISNAQAAHWGKLYIIEHETPRDFREFKRLAAGSPRKYGREEIAADGLPAWRAPKDEYEFRDLLKICRGIAEPVKG